MITEGLDYQGNLAMHIRLCLPNFKSLDFDFKNNLKAEDYIIPEVHIKQLKELAQ